MVKENDFASECSAFQTEMLRSFETLTCAYQTKRSDLPKERYRNSHRCILIYLFLFFIALKNVPSKTHTPSTCYSIILIFHQFYNNFNNKTYCYNCVSVNQQMHAIH